jgi:hypothetical protein
MVLVSVVGPRVHPAVEDIQASLCEKLKAIRHRDVVQLPVLKDVTDHLPRPSWQKMRRLTERARWHI